LLINAICTFAFVNRTYTLLSRAMVTNTSRLNYFTHRAGSVICGELTPLLTTVCYRSRYTAKNDQVVAIFMKQDWTMLSTLLNNIVIPDSVLTILFNIVDKCERYFSFRLRPFLPFSRAFSLSPGNNKTKENRGLLAV
jgi:hypothetical protein